MTPPVTLEVVTDPMHTWEIFGRPKQMTAGVTTTPVAGTDAVLRFTQQIEYRAVDMPAVLTAVLEHIDGVAMGILASWIYDKLKGRARSLRINRIEVQIEEGEIKRILLERTEIRE